MRRLRRIREEVNSMPLRESKRVIYAKSEFSIVAATYFYYVGLDEPMFQELNRLDPDELEQDSAQYLNYLYNIGSGGAIVKGTENEINQAELTGRSAATCWLATLPILILTGRLTPCNL